MSFKGYNEQFLTFNCASGLKAGTVVDISGNETVSASVSGGFAGLVNAVRGSLASVQVKGYMRLPYGAAAPGFGYQSLKTDANGKVIAASGGTVALVVDCDQAAGAVGIIL